MNYTFLRLLLCLSIIGTTCTQYEDNDSIFNTETENRRIAQKRVVWLLQIMRIIPNSPLGSSLISYLSTDVIAHMPTEALLLSPLPDYIKDTLNKFKLSENYFTFFDNPNIGEGAYICNREIHLGSDLLTKSTPEEITFVTGHEIAHHILNHASSFYDKRYFLITWWIFMEITHYSCGKLLGFLEKKLTHDTHPRLYWYIHKSHNIYKFLDTHPLLRYMISTTLGNFLIGKIYQYQEQEADLLSVQITGAKEGGISFFKKISDTESKLLRLVSLPFTILTHPSSTTRVSYLQALQT